MYVYIAVVDYNDKNLLQAGILYISKERGSFFCRPDNWFTFVNGIENQGNKGSYYVKNYPWYFTLDEAQYECIKQVFTKQVE